MTRTRNLSDLLDSNGDVKSDALDNVISEVSDDTTPALGGNLDVSGNSIVSSSNGDISITPNGTGSVVIDGLSHPQADGSNGQLLKTDGAGNLSFTDAPSSDLVDDTSPQLGANLDVNGNEITSASNGDVTINPNGTGDIILDANVGVGTASPSNPSGTSITVYDATTPRINLKNSTTGDTSTAGGEIRQSGNQMSVTNRQNSDLIFGTNNTERARINSSGNVGIGTTSPSYPITTNFNAPATWGNVAGNFAQMWQNSGTNAIGVAIGDDSKAGLTTNNGYVMSLAVSGNELIKIGASSGRYVQFYNTSGGETFRFDNNTAKFWMDGEGGSNASVDVRQGSAKMWVTFENEGTIGFYDSYNVSSITDHAVGNYEINLSNNMNDTNYSMTCGTAETSGTDNYARMTSAASVRRTTNGGRHWSHESYTGTARDLRYICNQYFGDQA